MLRHRQTIGHGRALQTRTTSYITTTVDVPVDVTRDNVPSLKSEAATTSLGRTSRCNLKRQQSFPPLEKIFGETITIEEVIASGEVFPSELVTPPIRRATVPGEEIAPEEETGPEEETARETRDCS